MEHGKQEVQPGIPLGRTWSKFPEDLSQRHRLQRPYGNHQSLESHQEVQTPGGEGKQDKGDQTTIQAIEEQLTQTGNTQIPSGSQGEGQISSPVASQHSETNRSVAKGHHSLQKQDHLQPKEERVRPNDSKAVVFGEKSPQEPEVVLHNCTISNPINRNITPTQIKHDVVTPKSNINSDALWLKMSQSSVKTQKQFLELEASH
ncbi:hypothetical protein O181_015178 [Austropuccinia psidii MF-1]|uniref:Uncharacterized protein n=1 Tax=Austropuccinia psidii MF-1 TaxID=1389203 RepID=A0A9Q3GPQ9_9BASI|nr:hypothetical protein [Austropuccinia psidii MF-1]